MADSLTQGNRRTDYMAQMGIQGKVVTIIWAEPAHSHDKVVLYYEDLSQLHLKTQFECPATLHIADCLVQHTFGRSLTNALRNRK